MGRSTRKRVRKLRVLSYARLQAIVMAFAGLVAGLIYSVGGFLIDMFVSMGLLSSIVAQTPGLSYGTFLAFGALIGMPLYFAVFGFITGVVGAFLYNVYVGWRGISYDHNLW